MARFSVQYKGNKALLSGLKKLKKETIQKIGDEIEASTYDLQSEAIQRVPVDTGFLKNSITAQYDASKLRGRVEARVHYAPYIEFGTGGLVDVPAGLEDYAIKFKGKGVKEVNIPPQPFMYPAFYRIIPWLPEQIGKIIKEATKK